ncbi:cytochrome b5, partial [Fistulina hepatica ATCC 64428]
MSWLSDFVTGAPREPYVTPEDEPRVPDPTNPERMISAKSANKPFLAYREYQRKQKEEHEAWLERKKEREEKRARGEEVGPEERDPTQPEEVGVLGLLKFLIFIIVFILLFGKFIAGSYLWGYDGKWARLRTYLPPRQRLFTEAQLATYDGSVPGRPIYLAVDGDVYDVTSGHAYQPGASYHILVGVDAARAFATGCFKTHRTHDVRGLSDQELQAIQHWKKFYEEHKDYVKVGRVVHPPIDPDSPIPESCKQSKGKKDD